MSEIGDIMEYNEEIEKSNKKKRNAKELYYKYRESHIKATQKWKEKNQDKVKEYEKKRYEKRKHLIEEKDKEIERLNNIINELFEYLKENSKQPELFESDRYYEDVLDKLQELLGSDKE